MAVGQGFTEEGGVRGGREVATGWVGCRKKENKEPDPLFILGVKSYLLPHCSNVGVHTRAGWWWCCGGGGGVADWESFDFFILMGKHEFARDFALLGEL